MFYKKQFHRCSLSLMKLRNDVVVVVSSSHQSPCLGVSLFRKALSITIQLSASKGSRKGGGCHEANDHSCGNGCALSGLFYSCTTKDSAVTGAQLCQYSPCLPWQCLFGCSNGRQSAIKQFDELLSMAVLTTSWWMLLIADL